MKIDPEIINLLKVEEPSIQELRNIAKGLGIKLRRSMKKRDIIREIKKKVNIEEIETSTSGASKKRMPFKASSLEPKIKAEMPKSNEPKELPKTYETDKAVIMPVNSGTIYTYWDTTSDTAQKVEKLEEHEKIVARIYQLENEKTDISDAERVFEIEVDINKQRASFINVPSSDSSYKIEIGHKDKHEEFKPVLKSNTVKTHSNIVKKAAEEEWYNLKTKKVEKVKVTSEIKKKYVHLIEKLSGSSVSEVHDEYKSAGGSFIWIEKKDRKE